MPIVTIDWLAGRDEQQKRTLAKEITDTLVKVAQCSPEAVTILFNDHPTTDIAKAGTLFSDAR